MAKLNTYAGTKAHKVVSPKAWVAARKALLLKEKKFTRLRDQLNKQRRNLPWEKVEKEYVFEGPNGRESLADLFGTKSQLFVYHFMFAPEANEGCPHCSFWADHYDSMAPHLNHRDVSFVVISRAPRAKLAPFQARMGWKFKWVSSFNSDFNNDYHVSFSPEQIESGAVIYNYAKESWNMKDREGASVFYKDADGAIYHTYSTYARGIDMLNGTYNALDLLPKGRDEAPDAPQAWVRYKDRYKD